MSATDSVGYIIELGENNLIIARANFGQRPRAIEDLREIWLGDNAAIETALGELKAAGTTGKAVALLRLKPRASFLSDAAQAQKIKTPGAAEDFLKGTLGADNFPANWSWVSAKDGRPPENGAAWLLDATPTSATDEALAKIKGWSFELLRCESGAISLAGAIAAAARTATAGVPVLFCDIAEARTHLYLINAQGIAGHTTAPAGFDTLAEATQGALGLKFRGSAARLLFNEGYDFADAAAKITEPLANALRSALPALGATAPTSLICGGLLAKQSWISQNLASALGLKLFAPDVAAWASANGLSLGSNVKADTVAPSWLGVLGAAAAYEQKTPGGTSPWHAVLTGTPVAAPPFVPALVVEPPPAPKPAVVITPPAKPVEAPAPAAKPAEAPKPAVVITPPAKPAAAPTPPAKPAVVVTPPAKPAAVVPTPAPKAAAPTPPAKPTDVKAPVKPAEPVKPAPAPAKPAPAPAPATKSPLKPEPAKPAAVAAKPTPAPAAARPATPAPFPKKKSNLPLIIGLVALLILGVGGFFVYSSNQKAKEQELQRVESERRAAEEAARKAEQAARIAEETRKRELEEARQRELANQEALKRQAEQDLRSTTERLLNARGTLSINTEPVGASVSIGDRAPRTTPATWNDLRLGRYDVTITLAGYDSEQRSIEVKENAVTDLGVVKLKRQVGSVQVDSDPSGLNFEIKPAGALFTNSGDIRSGKTPARVDDIPAGNYQVTITRANWPNYVANVTVERNGIAQVNSNFVGGGVTITSTPSGAAVLRDNLQIGTTPLTLTEQSPGPATFTVTQRGMDPVTLTGKIEPGKTLTLNATLLDSDRVMKLSELDENPVQLTIEEPQRTADQIAKGGNVTIMMTVGKDGIPYDLKVEQASDPALGRACLAAAAKWRFKPGTIKGKPVRTRVLVPFRFPPQ